MGVIPLGRTAFSLLSTLLLECLPNASSKRESRQFFSESLYKCPNKRKPIFTFGKAETLSVISAMAFVAVFHFVPPNHSFCILIEASKTNKIFIGWGGISCAKTDSG